MVGASDATEALRLLSEQSVDAAFLDISMPGLNGMELAAGLARYASPSALVFVTARDDRAVQAFEVGAVDYLLKPLRAGRLAQAIVRVLASRPDTAADETAAAPGAEPSSAGARPAAAAPPAKRTRQRDRGIPLRRRPTRALRRSSAPALRRDCAPA